MNIFLSQSEQTKIELEEIADVKKQIITPSKSVTIYGIKQDGLLGAYNMTDERTLINWRDAMNIMSYTTYDDFSKFKKGKDYTGSELFSMIIPSKITMSVKGVEIKNGDLVKGKLDNSMLGATKKNNLLQYIWDEYGEDATRNFIDNCQRLVNNFNLLNGFTVGIGDAQVTPNAKNEIDLYIANVMNKVDVDITSIENNPTYMNVETFEGKIFGDINVVRDDVSKIAMANVLKDNNFKIMIGSGSKGGSNNLGQMIGCVGHQAYEGGLMPKSYCDRTLCYFHENDDSAKSRGLCYNSYMDGLTYSEFCYHTKGGRAGLIEQVVKTSETGYAQRKLIKTLEDVMVKYDGTVRIANNQIVQQIYGGNGADTTMQYEYKINMIEMSNEKLVQTFGLTKDELTFDDFDQQDNQKMIDNIQMMRDFVRKNYVKAKLNYIVMNSAYMLPINITRVLSSVRGSNTGKNRISPKYILNKIEELMSIAKTPLVRISQKEMIDPSKRAISDDQIAKTLLRVAIYDALHPKNVNGKYNLTKEEFDQIIEELEMGFNNNIVEAGSMVGIIAAQSLGEAVTQMTLNAFHHAGIASLTHSTMGVPRINELISATKNQKTPTLFCYLNDSNRESREMAHKIGSYLEKTTFGNIRSKLDVYYDPNPHAKGGFMETDGITEPFYSKKLTRNSCQASVDNLPWLFRIEIDKEKMLDKEVTLLDIKSKFCLWWDRRHAGAKKKKEKVTLLRKITSFAMLSNTDNDPHPVIHIRFNVRDLDKVEKRKGAGANLKFNRKTLVEFIDMIDKFKLKGVENIEHINTIAKERYIDATDGDAMKIGEEQVIYTAGVNLKDIRYINGVNPYRTYSDSVTDMFTTFGVEFARSRMICEFMKAYENAGNVGLNAQHIAILVDIMCYGGSVISADRHGMKKANIDPLTKASFEKSVDVLVSAAVFSDVDRMQSVSSRLYIGSVFKGGTGYCELVLDTDMIKNSEYIDKETYSGRDTKNNIATNTIANAIMEDERGEEIYIPE
jgi:DNA-directed RNA polymerase II subunit RPB1